MVRKVGGYNMIPFTGGFSSYVYVKKHINKSESTEETVLAADRTAYVVNLPFNASEVQVNKFFKKLGGIQAVVMGKASNGTVAPSAHVVFKSNATLQKLLNLEQLPAFPGQDDIPDVFEDAINKYKSERPGLQAIKAEADKFMAVFDAEEEQERKEREELKYTIDADGFQTVVNAKRKRKDQEEILSHRKKQKSKELQDFYRFQLREKKRGQLKTLRERFDEDRQMVEKLKNARKFRPEADTD